VVQDGEGYKTVELWKTKEPGSTISQAVVHGDHIYLNQGFKQNVHGMACMTLDGKLKWQTGKAPTFDMGAILLADGLILAINGASGDLVMVEPKPEAYKELARTRILGGQKIWAPLALVVGKLLLRDHTKLVCVELKQ
jgi:outer membrane protein assembly factor BamB